MRSRQQQPATRGRPRCPQPILFQPRNPPAVAQRRPRIPHARKPKQRWRDSRSAHPKRPLRPDLSLEPPRGYPVSSSLSPVGDEPSCLTSNCSSTGDLRSSICDSGLFRQFAIPAATPSAQRQYVELPLDTPLSIEVGHDGIIGRRVSLCSGPIPSPENTVAQGIVGFNFLSHPSASF